MLPTELLGPVFSEGYQCHSKLMCKTLRQILIFGGEFFTVGGQENYFLVSI